MCARDCLLTLQILKLTLYSQGNNYWVVVLFLYTFKIKNLKVWHKLPWRTICWKQGHFKANQLIEFTRLEKGVTIIKGLKRGSNIHTPNIVIDLNQSSYVSAGIKNCAILLCWFPLFFIANSHTAIISSISERERERERERGNKSPIKCNPNLHFKSIVNWRSNWYSKNGR